MWRVEVWFLFTHWLKTNGNQWNQKLFHSPCFFCKHWWGVLLCRIYLMCSCDHCSFCNIWYAFNVYILLHVVLNLYSFFSTACASSIWFGQNVLFYFNIRWKQKPTRFSQLYFHLSKQSGLSSLILDISKDHLLNIFSFHFLLPLELLDSHWSKRKTDLIK